MPTHSLLEIPNIIAALNECAADYGAARREKQQAELLRELRQRQVALLQEYAERLRALEEDHYG